MTNVSKLSLRLYLGNQRQRSLSLIMKFALIMKSASSLTDLELAIEPAPKKTHGLMETLPEIDVLQGLVPITWPSLQKLWMALCEWTEKSVLTAPKIMPQR
jgi:hypothetical protein